MLRILAHSFGLIATIQAMRLFFDGNTTFQIYLQVNENAECSTSQCKQMESIRIVGVQNVPEISW